MPHKVTNINNIRQSPEPKSRKAKQPKKKLIKNLLKIGGAPTPPTPPVAQPALNTQQPAQNAVAQPAPPQPQAAPNTAQKAAPAQPQAAQQQQNAPPAVQIKQMLKCTEYKGFTGRTCNKWENNPNIKCTNVKTDWKGKDIGCYNYVEFDPDKTKDLIAEVNTLQEQYTNMKVISAQVKTCEKKHEVSDDQNNEIFYVNVYIKDNTDKKIIVCVTVMGKKK